jgi:hypothetical protein
LFGVHFDFHPPNNAAEGAVVSKAKQNIIPEFYCFCRISAGKHPADALGQRVAIGQTRKPVNEASQRGCAGKIGCCGFHRHVEPGKCNRWGFKRKGVFQARRRGRDRLIFTNFNKAVSGKILVGHGRFCLLVVAVSAT